MQRTATIPINETQALRAHGTSELFDCPVLKLVHFVFQDHGPRAFSILRRHIELNFHPDPTTLALIQVMAKRWRRLEATEELELLNPSVEVFEISKDLFLPSLSEQQRSFSDAWIGKVLSDPTRSLLEAETLVSLGQKRFESSRPIATFLTDEFDRVLSVGWNLRSQNRVWHAELVALKLLDQVKATSNFGTLKVVTSLQPCRMCSAYILEAASQFGVTVSVKYLRPDEGPKAKNTGIEEIQSPI